MTMLHDIYAAYLSGLLVKEGKEINVGGLFDLTDEDSVYYEGIDKTTVEPVNIKQQTYIVRFYEVDSLVIVAKYKNDLPHGKTIIYDDGEIEHIKNFKNGNKHGAHVRYYQYPNKKMEHIEYKDNRFHGKYITWHSNGVMNTKQKWNNDKMDGVCTYWYENGQMQRRSLYKNGKIVGKTTYWKPDGTKIKV